MFDLRNFAFWPGDRREILDPGPSSDIAWGMTEVMAALLALTTWYTLTSPLARMPARHYRDRRFAQ